MPKSSKSFWPEPPVRQRVTGEIPVPTLINWLSIGAQPLLLFFAYRAVGRGDTLVMGILLTCAALLLLNVLIDLVLRHETLQRRTFIVLITGLFIYLAISAIEDGSAIIWLFAYPPIIFYISTLRVGVLACAFGIVALIGLFSPAGSYLVNTPYSDSFRLVMVTALTFEMISCYFLDLSRRRSQARLLILAKEYEYAAKHDAMTGLANRREALTRLDAEYERYLRNRKPFSVILMDIDVFKGVNDSYGHQAGDQLIVMVAKELKEGCRRVDVVSRWGGEEFLAILPETSVSEAVKMANRIRQAIAARTLTFEGLPIRASISAGVATIHGAESTNRLLQRADEALYTAKATGRNRVCSGEVPEQDSA